MTTDDSAPAGPSGGGSGRTRYLIGATDPGLLSAVLARVAGAELADGVRVERVLPTGSGAISALVVSATPTQAQQLREEFGPGLLVEEDREIDPLPPVEPTD